MSSPLSLNGDAASLANWISESPIIDNPLALQRSKAAFIDTIACILAAAHEPATTNVFNALRSVGNGLCSVIGRAETLSAENAALVNGTAAHALDFDDNFLPAVTHASAVLVPALLALGEEVGASGDQLLDAYIVGLEIQAWLGHHMIPAHYTAGWHATSTIGAIGAAAACVRILALDNQSALCALSLATSMASGSKVQFGSMAKPLHAGLAARAGIMAARLASAGVKANENPFDGPWGFISLHHATAETAHPSAQQLAIIKDGLAQKRWPCCASAHRTLDAIQQLMQEHQLTAGDITKIETTVPDNNFQNLRFNRPKTINEARFSMTFCVAVMLQNGTLKLNDFSTETLQDPRIISLMKRVTMHSAGPQSDAGTSIWDFPATTVIHTKNQQHYERSILHPVGTISEPISEQDLSKKYFECAENLFPKEHLEGLFRSLLTFEKQKIRHIASRLRKQEAKMVDPGITINRLTREGTISLGAKT